MQRHPQRATRAGSSIAGIVVLFGLIPYVLVAAARARFGGWNPLRDIAPPWKWSISEVTDVLAAPLRDDAVVNLLIRASLTVIWIALAVILVTTLLETIHMVRHRGMPLPSVRGLGWAQRIARWVAIGIVATLPLSSFGSSTTAADAHPGPAATAQRFIERSESPTLSHTSEAFRGNAASAPRSFGDDHRSPRGQRSDASIPTHSHVVKRGESIYGIAQQLADRGHQPTDDIANAILDLNLDNVMNDGQRFVNPALIQPGWELQLPPDVGPSVPPSSPPFSSDAESTTTPVADDTDPTPVRGIPRIAADPELAPGDTHVVERGDTLSSIAAEHLGAESAWPALWEHHAGDDMGDGRAFTDPNLILPGWEIDVSVDNEPDVSVDRTAPPTTSESVDDEAANDPTPPSSDTPPSTFDPDPAPTSPPVSTTPIGSPPSTTTPSTTVPPVPVVGDQGGGIDHRDPAPQSPSPLRLEHAALLAAGLLTLMGVRRRRAWRAALPHARVPTPPPEVAAIERRLRTIDAGERSARIDIATRAIAYRVAETDVRIGTVRASQDGELTVRLTAPAHLDAPWVGTDSTWVLPGSVPIELLSGDARRAGQPCHALVTVGIDAEGRDVLLDLEAPSATLIEADPPHGDDVVRAIGAGLATSLSSEVVHLIVADLGAKMLFEHPNTRFADDARDALGIAAQIVGSTLANERSTFDLRTRRTGGEMWEPAVILAGQSDASGDILSQLGAPGHGIALVATVAPGSSAAAHLHDRSATGDAVIVAHPDRWELVAFGEQIELTPIGISASDVDDVTALLADASSPVEASVTPQLDPDRDTVGPLEVLAHDVVVSLMGGVTVCDRHGNPAKFERSKTIELVAWLATHRDRATRTAARTALWELDVRDATFANVVSEARRALARLTPPPDGEEWLARTLSESLPLHERVVTDIDLIRQRIDYAQLTAPAHAIDVLKPAVEMIRDLPFAGTSYLWPDADGLTSNLVLLAMTATGELAAHALSIGDTELVFWATGRGLRVLPGHEELIGLRMRAHARAGDLAGIRQEWESYERVITADSWSDGEPAPKLLALRRELLTAPT